MKCLQLIKKCSARYTKSIFCYSFRTLLESLFLIYLAFQITHLLFKLIFRANDLPQKSKFDLFQEALFCSLVSSTTLVLKIAPINAEQYYVEFVTFFTKDWLFSKLLGSFKNAKFKSKIICRLFHIFAQFMFSSSGVELDCYHQKVNLWVPLTSHQTTKDLGSLEIRKLQGNPWNTWNWWESIQSSTQKAHFDICATTLKKIACQTILKKSFVT